MCSSDLAALEWYGVPFNSVTPDDDTREQLSARAGTHQIPILESPFGWTVADTTPTLMWLDSLFPRCRLFPVGLNGLLVHLLEDVLDEWVSRVMVHYRWHHPVNTRFVIEGLVGRALSDDEIKQHPLARWGPRACRATGTESAQQQAAAEQEYLALLDALETQLGVTRYALGDCPSAVDAALIGGLRGHTLHDPLPNLSAYPRVCAWSQHTTPWDGDGNLSDPLQPTPFAEHLLGLARTCYQAFMCANRDALDDGQKAFSIDVYGEQVSFLTRAYPETARRMLVQRIDHGFDEHQREQVSQALATWGVSRCF